MRVYSGYYSLDASLGKYTTISTTGRIDKSSASPNQITCFYPSISVAFVLYHTAKSNFILKPRALYANVKGDATSSTIGDAPFLWVEKDYLQHAISKKELHCRV